MNFYTAFYDMDTNCVYVWMTDRTIITIDCVKVEETFADNLYQRSELDYLLDSDPVAYADLVLNDDTGRYLKAVTQCKTDESMLIIEKGMMRKQTLSCQFVLHHCYGVIK